MTTYVLLEIRDDDEAKRLIDDMASHPTMPLFSPVLENTVRASVMISGAMEAKTEYGLKYRDGAITEHTDAYWVKTSEEARRIGEPHERHLAEVRGPWKSLETGIVDGS